MNRQTTNIFSLVICSTRPNPLPQGRLFKRKVPRSALVSGKGSRYKNVVMPQYPGGDSYMEQTGMLVGNFEFNP